MRRRLGSRRRSRRGQVGVGRSPCQRSSHGRGLAAHTGTHAPSLYRFLRTLAGFGIVTEGDARRFALTPLGEALKTGAPGAARSTLLAFGGPAFWRTWEEIGYPLETGKPAFDHVFAGTPFFEAA